MRRKKEYDKESNSNRKTSQNKSGRVQNSILKIHDEKMSELTKNSKEKRIKELTASINKNNEEMDVLKKEMALKRVNKRGICELDSSYLCKISRLEESIKEMNKEMNYIKSGQKETDYILRTCNLINNYIILEERERELMMREDDNVEQELYELNRQKKDIIDDYMKIVDPNYTILLLEK